MNHNLEALPLGDAEATLREEGWVTAKEIEAELRDGQSPALQALRLLYRDTWVNLLNDVTDSPALVFFNREADEFSHARNWNELSEQYGIAPYSSVFRLPGFPPGFRDDWASKLLVLCRAVRLTLRQQMLENLLSPGPYCPERLFVPPIHPSPPFVITWGSNRQLCDFFRSQMFRDLTQVYGYKASAVPEAGSRAFLYPLAKKKTT